MKGRPYLDGYRAIVIRDTAPRVAAVRSGQAVVEFRGFNPAARDDIVKSGGAKIVVQESPWACSIQIVPNNEKKFFNDVRVRRALTLAIDRWGASKALSQISVMKYVGGLLRPGSEFATPEAEIAKLAGFGKNIDAARKEARRLLKEAGVPDGFAFTLKNRTVKEPYEIAGVYVIDQWRQVGLNGHHVQQEEGPYFNDLRQGAFDVSLDFQCDFMDSRTCSFSASSATIRAPSTMPDTTIPWWTSYMRSRAATTDLKERLKVLRQFERRVLDEKAYQFDLLWWQRIVPHWTKLKGWKITSSHYVNQDLRDVWLSE